MTVAGLEDMRIRCLAHAVKLSIVGRKQEAARWRAEADRYASLLSWDLPVYGTKVAS